jgi:hypothetical protein
MTDELKTCRACGIEKPVGPGGAFSPTRGDWRPECRECDAERRRKLRRPTMNDVPPVEEGVPASYEQIAAVMDTTVSAVQNLERRALRKLAHNHTARKEWAS